MDTTESFDWTTPPLRASIITQLAAIGLVPQQVTQLQFFLDHIN